MGGESFSSTSSLESGESSMGSQRELINISGAQLYLIDGEESVRMVTGEFSLKLLKQTYSPLALVVASVGEVQWPVGKDAPVLKVWNGRYTFALPGLVYGMVLPDSTPTAVLHHFEAIVAEYGAFETHYEIANAVQYAPSGRRVDDPGFWTALAPQVEMLSATVARNIDSTSTIVASSIVVGGDWAASGIRQGAALMRREGGRSDNSDPQVLADGGVSPRMMRRMQQARRMSAVAKLMSRTLLKGAISATGHVSKRLGLDVNAESYESPNYDTARNVAVASVDAFGKVVEAVESAGKSLYDATQKVGTDFVQERFGHEASQVVQDGFGAVGNVINTAWTLNKMGVKMLLRMTAASTALSRRSGSNTKSTTSTVTDDAHSRTSSTFSTGSMPMKVQHQLYSPPQTQILPPPQWSDPSSLHLSSPGRTGTQQLHTSQLFPTSAEQMKNHPLEARTSPVNKAGNYTVGILPPAPRFSNNPSQQYHWNVPHMQAPFSFQTASANLRKD